MSGQASVPVRLARMERHCATHVTESQIAELAAFYELDPAEVRAELERIQDYRTRFGPESIEATIARLAAEYDFDPEELRAEYAATLRQWQERQWSA